jgi:hypothetical protein
VIPFTLVNTYKNLGLILDIREKRGDLIFVIMDDMRSMTVMSRGEIGFGCVLGAKEAPKRK